jgi:uncharacterized protein (UPF0548 family)
MKISNEDIVEVLAEIPEGHRHIRTTVVLGDGTEFVFQEAAVANIVRAYVTLKTDPVKSSVRLKGKKLAERKQGYAEWQLVEE